MEEIDKEVSELRHLDSDVDIAIKRLKGVLQSKVIKFGVFDISLAPKTAKVLSVSVARAMTDGMYSETDSNIALDITYITSRMNMVNQPELPKQTMHLVLLPTIDDCTFPEMVELKLFGVDGKPSTVGVDKETGDIYLVYIFDNEIYFSHFATLSTMDKDFILSSDNMSTPYEFGVYKAALYRFITREEGWSGLRGNMYIQFNLSPIVRVKVGSTEADND